MIIPGLILFFGILAVVGIPLFLSVLYTEWKKKRDRRKDNAFECKVKDSKVIADIKEETASAILKMNSRLEELERKLAEKNNEIRMLAALTARKPRRRPKDIEVRYTEGNSYPYIIQKCFDHISYAVILAEPGASIVWPYANTGVTFPIGASGCAFCLESCDKRGIAYGIILSREAADSPYAIVHETWHMFHRMLQKIDGEAYTPDVMASAIYAYTFSALYQSVLTAFQELTTREKIGGGRSNG